MPAMGSFFAGFFAVAFLVVVFFFAVVDFDDDLRAAAVRDARAGAGVSDIIPCIIARCSAGMVLIMFVIVRLISGLVNIRLLITGSCIIFMCSSIIGCMEASIPGIFIPGMLDGAAAPPDGMFIFEWSMPAIAVPVPACEAPAAAPCVIPLIPDMLLMAVDPRATVAVGSAGRNPTAGPPMF